MNLKSLMRSKLKPLNPNVSDLRRKRTNAWLMKLLKLNVFVSIKNKLTASRPNAFVLSKKKVSASRPNAFVSNKRKLIVKRKFVLV